MRKGWCSSWTLKPINSSPPESHFCPLFPKTHNNQHRINSAVGVAQAFVPYSYCCPLKHITVALWDMLIIINVETLQSQSHTQWRLMLFSTQIYSFQCPSVLGNYVSQTVNSRFLQYKQGLKSEKWKGGHEQTHCWLCWFNEICSKNIKHRHP